MKYIKYFKKVLNFISHRGLLHVCSLRLYLKILYYSKMDKKLNIDNPETFNEKLNWLKLNYRDNKMICCTDKYMVRKYVANKIGDEYLIELYGVFNSVDNIDISKLPEKFVLKPNHSSSKVLICKNKNQINWDKEFYSMKKWLKENYYYVGGEWQYKDIEPKIICEKLLAEDIIDYKFYCFNGEPKYIYLYLERDIHVKTKIYDLEWNEMQFVQGYMKSNRNVKKPKQLDKMIEISRVLAEGFPFVRVDLYEIDDKIYFGELTFFPYNAIGQFAPIEFEYMDYEFGKLLDLKNIMN